MTKFNVGDKVTPKPGQNFTIDGRTVRVTEVADKHPELDTLGQHFRTVDAKFTNFWYNSESFTLVEAAIDPIEAAQKLLKEAGFTITPPEKKKGEVVVYTYTKGDTNITCVRREVFDSWSSKNGIKMLAIVPWTEGDGMK